MDDRAGELLDRDRNNKSIRTINYHNVKCFNSTNGGSFSVTGHIISGNTTAGGCIIRGSITISPYSIYTYISALVNCELVFCRQAFSYYVGVSSHCKPSEYQLLELPRPEITDPKDVIIKVHAASVNPVDLKKAEGVFKIALKDSFPYKTGYDAAGTVVEIGTDVSRFKVGDSVYVRLPESHRGTTEYRP
ncbi:hypothetical protein DTO166G4_4106 [Paecilomyces variotii]|nr:hypothetical protein DTO166G4_4106 [Paecilomyces variotii]KAJ9228932.1 hypothetical protein DTO169E5_9021 [Paecilomyces variotii]KAJ9229874.1 hypothetical protein DTO166G5_7597 [Paecilomyces variotii]KAJ9263311.1 hypothetical protein DTO195F2_2967 [Paecilomyces variotii]KAJ9283361.1 hypothetical protein DTO021C3_9053 [Paecilomyces variotii]